MSRTGVHPYRDRRVSERRTGAAIGLLRSLWWAARGRRAVGPHEVALSYGDRFTVLLWTVCCLGALELGVVHVLTARWPLLRWTLFALGVLSIVWFVGFGLSLRSHPHLLRNDELVLRFGRLRATRVPLAHLAAVHTTAQTGHRRNLVLADDRLTMAVMGDSNMDLRFDPPVDVEVQGRLRSLSRISFYADDPRDSARLLRSRAEELRRPGPADRGR